MRWREKMGEMATAVRRLWKVTRDVIGDLTRAI